MANKNQAQEEVVENGKLSFEEILKKYQKAILAVIVAVLVIVLAVLAINKWVIAPRTAEAQGQMFPAEASFANGDFEVALNGDGNNLGFADIISQYKGAAGKIVYFYAGVCELQLGNNEQAISYLNKYKGGDKILNARAICCKGDAYANLNKLQEAVKCFEQAAKVSDNDLTPSYLLKAGRVYETLGNNSAALKCYQQIKDEYPYTNEGYDIDKYITRIQNK